MPQAAERARRPDPAAAGLQPPAGAAAADRSTSNAGRRGMRDMLRAHARRGRRAADWRWPTGCARSRADPGQLEQVLLNLAVNARDAMPDGGTLTIETANVALEPARARPSAAGLPPGRYVVLAVTDTGTGMDAGDAAARLRALLHHQGAGKGTGLGPAMVYGIVKQTGGHIEVDSEAGRGTTFRLYLPRADAGEAAPRRRSRRAAWTAGGTETVLVVEDEAAVRRRARCACSRRRLPRARGRRRAGGAGAAWMAEGDRPAAHRRGDARRDEWRGAGAGGAAAPAAAEGPADDGLCRGLDRAGRCRRSGFEIINKPYRRLELGRKIRQVLDGPAGIG